MKLPIFALAALAALACLAPAASAQVGVEDQISPFGSEVGTANDTLINFGLTSLEWQATVQAGVPGWLEGIQFEVSGPAGDSFTVRIHLGAPWQSGPAVYTTTLTKTSGLVEIMYADLTSSGIYLAVGDFYTIAVGGESNTCKGTGSLEAPSNTYYPPALYGNAVLYDQHRLGFHTWMLPDYPPELTVSGAPGGPMDFDVQFAEPNGLVAYLYAFGPGSHTVTNPITGTQMVTGLASNGFTVVAWPAADANGNVTLSRTVPSAAAGLVCVQAIDLTGDQVSNVVCL
jgi:hypothetical protein